MEEVSRRIQELEDTLCGLERDADLLEGILYTREHTVIYQEADVSRQVISGKYVFYGEEVDRSLWDILRLWKEQHLAERIGVIISADACHPGGNAVRGGGEMEAILCRWTTLYPCLNTSKNLRDFYRKNVNAGKEAVWGTCLYLPGLWQVKQSDGWLDKSERVCFDGIVFPHGRLYRDIGIVGTEDGMETVLGKDFSAKHLEGIFSIADVCGITGLILCIGNNKCVCYTLCSMV